jgi:uncharacterized protein YggE
VTFDLSNDLKNQKLQEAREIAVAEAKTKATGLAKAANITLGKIINISENTPLDTRMYALPVGAGNVADKVSTQPEVQPGTTEINVTISLSYEIR